jgi:hypothetical protein
MGIHFWSHLLLWSLKIGFLSMLASNYSLLFHSSLANVSLQRTENSSIATMQYAVQLTQKSWKGMLNLCRKTSAMGFDPEPWRDTGSTIISFWMQYTNSKPQDLNGGLGINDGGASLRGGWEFLERTKQVF